MTCGQASRGFSVHDKADIQRLTSEHFVVYMQPVDLRFSEGLQLLRGVVLMQILKMAEDRDAEGGMSTTSICSSVWYWQRIWPLRSCGLKRHYPAVGRDLLLWRARFQGGAECRLLFEHFSDLDRF